jgi:hypothetical protein
MEFLTSIFTELLLKQLLTLLGLIVFQVLLSVALSLRQNKFEWSKLADFYRVMVLPFVLGWLGFVLAARMISGELLGSEYSVLVGDGVTWLSWLAVVASLGARIFKTLKAIYGNMLPVPEPDPDYLNSQAASKAEMIAIDARLADVAHRETK